MEGISGAEFKEMLDDFNESINSENTQYKPRTQNSNTYTGDAIEHTTGKTITNKSGIALPGIKEDLPRKKPEKKEEPAK